MNKLQCISPVDGRLYVERLPATHNEIQTALDCATSAQKRWRQSPLAEREILCSRAVDAFVA